MQNDGRMKVKIRRLLFALAVLATVQVLPSRPCFAANRSNLASQQLVYVGTYTGPESKGIYAFRYDPITAQLTSLGLAAKTEDPSFLVLSSSGRFLYAVNEVSNFNHGRSGAISAYRVDEQSGKLTLLNRRESHGADPCYIAIDKTGKYVLVANYTGGSIAVLPINRDGSLAEASQSIQDKGSSVNAKRQEGPHAHWIDVSPDNRFVLVADLGTDELMVYKFNPDQGTLTPNDPPVVKVMPGAGPRHPAFSPDGRFVYVVNELQSNVSAFAYDATKGSLKEFQSISMLPQDFHGKTEAAEIQIDRAGKFLYASNRGHDSIAVFAIDPEKGTLTLVEIVSTQGREPRHFAIDPSGSFLLVENQKSNNIVTFQIDRQTGKLHAADHAVHVGAPVCLQFVPIGPTASHSK